MTSWPGNQIFSHRKLLDNVTFAPEFYSGNHFVAFGLLQPASSRFSPTSTDEETLLTALLVLAAAAVELQKNRVLCRNRSTRRSLGYSVAELSCHPWGCKSLSELLII